MKKVCKRLSILNVALALFCIETDKDMNLEIEKLHKRP